MEDVHSENHMAFMKEREDDNNNRNDILWSQIIRINIVRRPYYPKQLRGLMQSLSKYSWHFFRKLGESIIKYIWNLKRPQIVKAILKKKNKVGSLTLPDHKA